MSDYWIREITKLAKELGQLRERKRLIGEQIVALEGEIRKLQEADAKESADELAADEESARPVSRRSAAPTPEGGR